MAKRRMIATSIIESDVFCTLSPSSQALYLHLIANADDDGIVDKWKSLLRYLRIRHSHLQPLINTEFVIVLDGDLLLISDWQRHNKIRFDKYNEGQYKDRLEALETHKNGRYFKPSEDFFTPQHNLTQPNLT